MVRFRNKFLAGLMRFMSSPIASLTGFFNNSYPSLDASRKEIFNGWRPRYGTANQIIAPALTAISAQCRHLERFTPWARAVADGLVADVVGSGIDVLPVSGRSSLDERLQDAWHLWAETAMVDGSSLWTWQATAMREIVTSGAALARMVLIPDRIERGMSPMAILPLEVEWLAEHQGGPVPEGQRFIRGVVVDRYMRPVSYHLRNPEAPLGAPVEIVPAAEILHVYERRRPQQVHGEPLLAPAVERILQDARLVETELKASVNTAALSVFISSPTAGLADGNETDDDGSPITDIPAGAVVRGGPGETVSPIANPRPSQQIGPFRQTLVGDVAGACRVSRYWLEKDPSRANFSSMRLDQLTAKRALVMLKETLGVGVAGRVYEAVFEWLMLSIGERMPSSQMELASAKRYVLRPDQPEYVDPVKDTEASLRAIGNKLSTHEIELSSRGKNWEEVLAQASREDRAKDKASILRIQALQRDIEALNAETKGLNLHWSQIVTLGGSQTAPGAYLAAVEQPPSGDPEDKAEEGPDEEDRSISPLGVANHDA